jgi:hypothetical protein
VKHNRWKFVYVLAAISALAVARHGFAQQCFTQQSNGSPDGLYAVPDGGQIASNVPESTSDRSAQSYLSSLDSQGEQFKHEVEKAEAARQATAAAKRLKTLAANSNSNLPSLRPNLSERTWITILAVGGLLLSLAAGGVVWWSRVQSLKGNRALLVPATREPAVIHGSIAKHDVPPGRRAA